MLKAFTDNASASVMTGLWVRYQ